MRAPHATFTGRLHLLVVGPLLFVTVAVAAITAVALSTNADALQQALRHQGSADRAFALHLTQEDASKAILLDPTRLADFSGAKLAAHDEHRALLASLRREVPDPEVQTLLAESDRGGPIAEQPDRLAGFLQECFAPRLRYRRSEPLDQRFPLVSGYAVEPDIVAVPGEDLLKGARQRTVVEDGGKKRADQPAQQLLGEGRG